MSHDRAIGIPKAKHIRADEFKAKIVCGSCHDIITDTIESPARPLLKKLLRGQADLIEPEQQRVLAAWGAKTAVTQWGMTQRHRGVSIAHRRALIERAEPHPAVYVAYSRCAGGWLRPKFARSLITLRETGERIWVYEFLFAFATVAVHVFAPANGRRRFTYKQSTSRAARLWPPNNEPSRWPPGRIIDDDAYDELWAFDPRALRESG